MMNMIATLVTLVLAVRVNPKAGQASFYRCGMQFTREWTTVEVDAATAQRLREEQMLEVEDAPADAPNTPPEEGASPVAAPATGAEAKAFGEAEAQHQAQMEAAAEAAGQDQAAQPAPAPKPKAAPKPKTPAKK